MSKRRRPFPWLWLTAIASIVLSLLGIVYAVHCGHASDGGRGGAVGCMLTFLIFFLGRPTPNRVLSDPVEIAAGKQEPDPLIALPAASEAELIAQAEAVKFEVGRVRGAVAAMLDLAAREKVCLSVASVASTFFWGFGDLIAAWLGAKP